MHWPRRGRGCGAGAVLAAVRRVRARATGFFLAHGSGRGFGSDADRRSWTSISIGCVIPGSLSRVSGARRPSLARLFAACFASLGFLQRFEQQAHCGEPCGGSNGGAPARVGLRR